MRKTLLLVCILGLLLFSAPLRSQLPSQIRASIQSLQALLEIEQHALGEDKREYEQNRVLRKTVGTEILEKVEQFDALILEEPEVTGDVVEVRKELSLLLTGQQTLRERATILRERILERRSRITDLISQIEQLQAKLPGLEESVDGVWTVNVLPTGQRGRFILSQTGTLVHGQYEFGGGRRGSVEGVFVNRRMEVDMIDSTEGLVSRYSGKITDDGLEMKGTWQNTDISGGIFTGTWVAERQDEGPSSEEQELQGSTNY